jgi:hypothetical protein
VRDVELKPDYEPELRTLLCEWFRDADSVQFTSLLHGSDTPIYVHCIVCPARLCATVRDFEVYLREVLPTVPSVEHLEPAWRQVFGPTLDFFRGFDAVVLVSAAVLRTHVIVLITGVAVVVFNMVPAESHAAVCRLRCAVLIVR